MLALLILSRYNPDNNFGDAFTYRGGSDAVASDNQHTGFVLSFAATANETLFTAEECPIVPYTAPAVERVPFDGCPDLEAQAYALCPTGPLRSECIEDVGLTCTIDEWVKDAQDGPPVDFMPPPTPPPTSPQLEPECCACEAAGQCADTTYDMGGEQPLPWTNNAWHLTRPDYDEQPGLNCEQYVTEGFCVGGRVIPNHEWAFGLEWNWPEGNCCACGGGRMASLTGACADAERWSNGAGLDCGGYKAERFCAGGEVLESWAVGDNWNNPEASCCVCGGGSRGD